MVRLYAATAAIVVALSLVAGFITYEVKKTTTSSASCAFRINLPLSDHLSASDSLTFTNTAASGFVARATFAGAPALGAAAVGEPASVLADSVSVEALIGSTYTVQVKNSNADRAVKLVNAVCASYVKQIQTELSTEQQAEQDQIQAQIGRLQTALGQLPAADLTPAQQSQSRVLQMSLTRSEALLAQTMAVVPFTVSTASEAHGAASVTTPRAGLYLLIAGVSGLLISFLLILILESVRDRKPASPAVAPDDREPPVDAAPADVATTPARRVLRADRT